MSSQQTEIGPTRIRLAVADDLEALWPLYEQIDELHRQQRPDIFRVPDGPRRSRDFLQERINNPDCCLFVAKRHNHIVGLATVILREKPESLVKQRERYAEIDEIVVDKACQRQNIGGALLETCRKWAQAQPGISTLKLSVFEFNQEALQFYQAKGFRTLYRTMELRL